LIFILVIDSPCVPVSVFGFVDGQTANETNRVTIRQPEPQSIADLLGALTEIRSDNQEQFERCVCHFRLTQWIAGTLDDAMSDPSKPLRGEAVCEWRKRGEDQMVIVDAHPLLNPETIVDSGEGFKYGFRAYASSRQILNGMLWMAAESTSGTIHLTGGNSPQCLTPWTMTTSPFDSRRISNITTELIAASVPGLIAVRVSNDDETSAEFEFDLSRGGLLSRAVYSNADGELLVNVIDSQLCPGGGWFPTHIRRVISSTKTPDEFLVDECRVSEILSDLPEDLPDMQLLFEAGSSINTPTLGNMAMTKLEQPKMIGPENLVELIKECEATEARVRATGSPGFGTVESSSKIRRVWPPAVIGAFFGAVSFCLLKLWRRNREIQQGA